MANVSPDIKPAHSATTAKEIRVAWLFPSLARGYYWQPVFKEFAAYYPCTSVFTSIWPGFATGYENSFEVQTLPGLGYIDVKRKLLDSRRGFIWTPPSILKKLAAFRPDVVFSSGFSGWTLCALLFKLIRRVRVIIYWEGCSSQSVGSSKVKTLLRRGIAGFADAGVCNAHDGMRYLREVMRMPAEKLLCHPCQVPDLSLLGSRAAETRLPPMTRPVFLYVGSLNQRKGWRYLLDATQLLISKGVTGFSVLIVGAGEEDEQVRSVIRDHNLGLIVKQVGAVAYHNLGPYYRGADVFVSPTRADTWGVAVLEAMAFGIPVLCSKYAGSRQMISHGDDGYIFNPFDTEELAGYMAQFIHDPDLSRRMGRRCLEKMAPFTPASAAHALANLAVQST